MPTQGLIIEPHNFDELQRALEAAPEQTYRFVKTEMFRFARRTRRKLISERMRGRPGIVAGMLAKGNNVQAFQMGSDLASLKAVNKITRILRMHEEGGVIPGPVAIRLKDGIPTDPRKVPGLFKMPNVPALAVKEGNGIRVLYLLRRGVRIPARLGFQALWLRELPDGQARVHSAMERALRVAMERQMKTLTSAALQVVHG